MKPCIRQAKEMIPNSGLGKDMQMILADVLEMHSSDARADLERVRNACTPLPFEWAQSAADLLEKAAEYFREQALVKDRASL